MILFEPTMSSLNKSIWIVWAFGWILIKSDILNLILAPCSSLVYGYSYGIRSSRKLERATHHNLSFIWLTGGLKPDHKTIARFRRDHRDVLKICLNNVLISESVWA